MIFLLCLLIVQLVDIDSTEVQSRVFNGHIAKQGEFPYVVGLSMQHWRGSGWCSGNIISNQWILTAAHCLDQFTLLSKGYIYFGSTVREQGLQKSFGYGDVVKHPAYFPYKNDLALIKTSRIRFSDNIKAIALPSSKDTSPNQWAFTAGWNKKDFPKPEPLMWTKVKISSGFECSIKYLTIGAVLCGRVNSESSICQGDSGGPLVHSEKKTLVGVTSFVDTGNSCDNGELVGFVNVANYLDWIRRVSGVRSLN